MWVSQRSLRIADGPDEVHHMVVGRAEVRKYEGEEYRVLADKLGQEHEGFDLGR
jgi:hypothetical protein